MRRTVKIVFRSGCFVACAIAAGCGGPQATPTPKPEGPGSNASSASNASSGSPSTAASVGATHEEDELSPATKAAVAAASASPPLTAADGSVVLENLLKKGDGGFPKATAKDADCINGLAVGGNHDEDYAAMTGRCGSATGLKEYTKKVTGTFDEKHHRNAYTFNMQGGFCYRFFVAGDDTMGNIDIRVQRPEGALVSIAQGKGPRVVMDPDRVWCKTHDREFRLVVETASGKGKYVLGVWARPK